MNFNTFFNLTAIITVILILNLYLWQNMWLGMCFFVCFLIINSFLYSRVFAQSKYTILHSFFSSLLIILSGVSLIGAIIYYVYQLNDLIISFILILIMIIPLLSKIDRKIKLPLFNFKLPKSNILVGIFTYLALVGIGSCQLFQNQTIQAISSPWQVIPPSFFGYYFLSTLILILILWFQKNTHLSLILISIHTFFSLSIALIIYKLGFGYDPFIHQSTEKTIFDQGHILPKPLYYLGQYALVVFLAKTTQISVVVWDKILLISLASIYLPYFIYHSLKALRPFFLSILPKPYILLSTLAFLAIPFPYLIVTTPQGLANLYIILLIFCGILYYKKLLPLWFLSLLTASSLSIHALAGIPALIFIILLILIKSKFKLKNIVVAITTMLSAFLIPFAFIISAKINHQALSFIRNNILVNLKPFTLYQLHYPLLDLIYFYGFNIALFIGLGGFVALIYLIVKNNKPLWSVYLLTAIVVTINYLLISRYFVFESVIEYERHDFAERLFQILLFLFYPAIFFITNKFIEKLNHKGTRLIKIFFLLLFTGLISTSLYLSYPRWDNYQSSQGFNVSQADFETIQLIDEHSQDKNYIVLAPQTTSAAALTTFGFDNLRNNHYFYPIPTADPLYQYFLNMINNQPTRETADQAMELTKTQTLYFVIPKYWRESIPRADQAKQYSTDNFQTSDQEISIFRFEKNEKRP